MKKGLSPLIATVLLIGITISMAALVMVWGQNLVKQTTEETGESATTEIKCISRVTLELLNASCWDFAANAGLGGSKAPDMNLILDNRNEEPIDGIILRVYGTGNVVRTRQIPYVLGAFSTDVTNIVAAYSGLPAGGVTKVEILPQIKLSDGSLKTCGQRAAVFSMPSTGYYGCI